MKVIVPSNTVPNSILIQDIDPLMGIVIVYKDQLPYGFVTYDEEQNLFLLHHNTMGPSGICGNTLSHLLKVAQKNISGDISLEYFETAK